VELLSIIVEAFFSYKNMQDQGIKKLSPLNVIQNAKYTHTKKEKEKKTIWHWKSRPWLGLVYVHIIISG
jgi:hypothetical protein